MIPLVAAGACTVPAVLGTRALGTMRERIIASSLACMQPCSACTAVIAGVVALFVSWKAALGIYAIAAALIVLAGWALDRVLPGATSLTSFVTRDQIFVYALVNTLYMPCVATLAVLAKELGWRAMLAIAMSTMLLALAVGGLAHGILRLLYRGDPPAHRLPLSHVCRRWGGVSRPRFRLSTSGQNLLRSLPGPRPCETLWRRAVGLS